MLIICYLKFFILFIVIVVDLNIVCDYMYL